MALSLRQLKPCCGSEDRLTCEQGRLQVGYRAAADPTPRVQLRCRRQRGADRFAADYAPVSPFSTAAVTTP